MVQGKQSGPKSLYAKLRTIANDSGFTLRGAVRAAGRGWNTEKGKARYSDARHHRVSQGNRRTSRDEAPAVRVFPSITDRYFCCSLYAGFWR
jgi:hypothetical protein